MLRSVLRATFTVLLRFRKVTFTILPSPTLRSAHAPCTAPPHTPRGRARSLVLWSGRVQLDRRLLAPALDAWLRVEVRATHHAEVDAVVERARTQRRRARRWRHVVFERRRHLRLLVVELGLRHWRRLAGGQRLRGQRRLPLGRVVTLRRAHQAPSRNTWRGSQTPVCSRRRRPRMVLRNTGFLPCLSNFVRPWATPALTPLGLWAQGVRPAPTPGRIWALRTASRAAPPPSRVGCDRAFGSTMVTPRRVLPPSRGTGIAQSPSAPRGAAGCCHPPPRGGRGVRIR